MSEQLQTAPSTEDVVAVLRRVAETRRSLTPQQQAVLDYLVRRAVHGPADDDVMGYGLGDWLSNALKEIVALLEKPYKDADEATLAAMANAWGLA